MSTPIVEGRHAGEFILGEANHNRSREVLTISDSVAIKPGDVLGKVTADGKYQPYDNANSPAGIGTASAIAIYGLGATDTPRKITCIVRDCTVNGKCLGWGSQDGSAQTAGIADMLASNIIVR